MLQIGSRSKFPVYLQLTNKGEGEEGIEGHTT